MSDPTNSQPPASSSSDSLNPAENDALTRSPLGGRKRTDTMYFSGDFNVLDPTFGIGSLGEGDGLPVEVPKVPSEDQEESDEWVLPERAYGDHESEEGVSHEHEEGIPVEIEVEQDIAPEADEKSVGGYTEPTPTPTPSEEDPFADNSADISAAEVEAQLEESDEEPAESEETTEAVVETDRVVDEAPVEQTQEGSEATVAEVPEAVVPEAVVPELEVSGEHVIEDEEKKD